MGEWDRRGQPAAHQASSRPSVGVAPRLGDTAPPATHDTIANPSTPTGGLLVGRASLVTSRRTPLPFKTADARETWCLAPRRRRVSATPAKQHGFVLGGTPLVEPHPPQYARGGGARDDERRSRTEI
jgi:hypothetical protein